MNIVQKRFVHFGRLMDKIKTGYSQNAVRRWSVLDRIRKTLIPMKDVDCSAAFAILCWLAGIPWDMKTNTSTRNIAQKARATGMFSVEYFDGDLSKLKPAGALLEPGHHIASMLDHGEMLSPEQTEKHTIDGGKPGEQASYEVRIRKAYKRRSGEKNGGWTYILNLLPISTHARRAIVAAGKRGDWKTHIKRMTILAPHDGPLFGKFIETWNKYNQGISLKFSAVTNPVAAIVVLGTKLKEDGSVTKKFVERLQLAADQARLNPKTIVIVSGGRPYNGITEGQAGRKWLLENGIEAHRVYIEGESSSTIGNAKYTVALMQKLNVKNYILVSHASHLRRAALDFLAATLGVECDTNKATGFIQETPLAVNDYGSNPIKPQLPISASDQAVMASEILSILGL